MIATSVLSNDDAAVTSRATKNKSLKDKEHVFMARLRATISFTDKLTRAQRALVSSASDLTE